MHACQLVKTASAKQHAQTRLAAGSRAGARKVQYLVNMQSDAGVLSAMQCAWARLQQGAEIFCEELLASLSEPISPAPENAEHANQEAWKRMA